MFESERNRGTGGAQYPRVPVLNRIPVMEIVRARIGEDTVLLRSAGISTARIPSTRIRTRRRLATPRRTLRGRAPPCEKDPFSVMESFPNPAAARGIQKFGLSCAIESACTENPAHENTRGGTGKHERIPQRNNRNGADRSIVSASTLTPSGFSTVFFFTVIGKSLKRLFLVLRGIRIDVASAHHIRRKRELLRSAAGEFEHRFSRALLNHGTESAGARFAGDRLRDDFRNASSVKSSLIPSISNSFLYCFTRAFFGSVRMRRSAGSIQFIERNRDRQAPDEFRNEPEMNQDHRVQAV